MGWSNADFLNRRVNLILARRNYLLAYVVESVESKQGTIGNSYHQKENRHRCKTAFYAPLPLPRNSSAPYRQ
jgi:hypothetical protein